ncbi:MAG: UvrD-helicase domain-containing protein [Clostridia bacterium]|nr:UvrD-helicase domain-containing protein [Clostridia bacterium]
MIPNPTQAQKAAIDLRGHDLIVSAGAGSGKTAVMVDRVVQQVLEGAGLDEILMVTFTNASAAEMRERIGRELRSRIAQGGPQADRLRRELNRLPGAEICTINAYCMRLVRRFFHLAQIDPLFTVGSRTELTLLEHQAVSQLCEEAFDARDPAFLDMLEWLFSDKEAIFRTEVQEIYRFSRTCADPDGFFEHALSFYSGGAGAQRLVQEFEKSFASDLREALDAAAEALDTARAKLPEKKGKQPAPLEKLPKWMDSLCLCMKMVPGETLVEVLQSIPSVSRHKSYPAELNALLGRCSELLKRLKENNFARLGAQGILSQLQQMHAPAQTLVRCVRRYEQIYTELKRQRNLIDFSDSEHLALRILQNEEARAEICAQYKNVCIDEYQDTNDLQEAILTRIAPPGRLFCVGDVKQSIYGFRQAEPALFLNRYAQATLQGRGHRRIDLNSNFRSTEQILQFVNLVFKKSMTPECGGLAYDEDQALKPGRPNQGPPISLELICSGIEVPENEFDEEINSTQAEQYGALCARIIRGLTQTEGYRFRDIAILLRKRKDIVQLYEALRLQGIPVQADRIGNPFETPECLSVLELLRAIDNARSDQAILGALRSPAALFSAADLARIRIHRPDLPFALATRAFAETGTGETAQKARRFFALLNSWRAEARTQTVDMLLTRVYEQTDLYAYYALQADGSRRVDNLRLLWLQAQDFARTGDGSLSGFLMLIDQMQLKNTGELSISPAVEDAVRIGTIHGAKGLEFPVVLLPCLTEAFGGRNHGIYLSREYGIPLRLYDPRTRSYRESPVMQAANALRRSKELDEELRLLYVALTRPREKLVLMGSATPEKYRQMIRNERPSVTCAFQWILPALAERPGAAPLLDLTGLPAKQGEDTVLETHCWADLMLSPLPTPAPVPVSVQPQVGSQWVEDRFSYVYPFAAETKLPSKVTVTAITEGLITGGGEPMKPPVLGQPVADGAMIGTAVHNAISRLDVTRASNKNEIETQLNEMARRGLITAHQRTLVRPEVLLRFVSSPLGKRLAAAQTVLREQPFNLRVPASLITPEADPDAQTVLQGMLDCAFIENGAWILLDYKTNRLPEGGAEALANHYRPQLDAYRYALETLTGRPVAQTHLCLLSAGINHPMAPGPLYELLQSGLNS